MFVLFCKQKTAYERRISDWSSDVCSSDLLDTTPEGFVHEALQLVDLGLVWTEYLFHDGREPAAGTGLIAQSGEPCARFLRKEPFGLIIVVDHRGRPTEKVVFVFVPLFGREEVSEEIGRAHV